VADKFPILDVAKASILMPFNSPVNILKAIGLLVAGVLLLVVLTMASFAMAGGSMAAFSAVFEGNATQEVITQQLAVLDGVGAGLLGLIIGLFILLGLSAHIFNYWVRFATFGKEGASFGSFGAAASAAVINGLKFLLIFILIGVVVLVANFVLSTFGLTASLEDQTSITDSTDQYLAGFSTNIIAVIVTCFIYSIFSANLTQTAIGNDQEALEHPHAMDFSVVLMIIYAALIVPMIITAVIGSDVLFMIVQYVFSVLVMLAIPAAHGLRYRICTSQLEGKNGGIDDEENMNS